MKFKFIINNLTINSKLILKDLLSVIIKEYEKESLKDSKFLLLLDSLNISLSNKKSRLYIKNNNIYDDIKKIFIKNSIEIDNLFNTFKGQIDNLINSSNAQQILLLESIDFNNISCTIILGELKFGIQIELKSNNFNKTIGNFILKRKNDLKEKKTPKPEIVEEHEKEDKNEKRIENIKEEKKK